MKALIRQVEEKDYPALEQLWAQVFGDKPECIRAFLRLLPRMGFGVLAELEGVPCAMAYIITDLALRRPGMTDEPCGYLYAVASCPALRGHGLGRAVTAAALDEARRRGCVIRYTLPADEGLREWYSRDFGLSRTFLRRSVTLDAVSLNKYSTALAIDAEQYSDMREALLSDRCRIAPGAAAGEYIQELCRIYGGGLFSCEDGICIVSPDDGKAVATELIPLPGHKPERIAGAAATTLGYDSICFHIPCSTAEAQGEGITGYAQSDCAYLKEEEFYVPCFE